MYSTKYKCHAKSIENGTVQNLSFIQKLLRMVQYKVRVPYKNYREWYCTKYECHTKTIENGTVINMSIDSGTV